MSTLDDVRIAQRAANEAAVIAYLVRIAGLRLTVSATSVWDAIDQVRAVYPLARGGSARPA